ncbi:MAG: heparan-alpha-glucosaminide N-acetyltransferase domain-containing protein [Bacteroidota bacterium]
MAKNTRERIVFIDLMRAFAVIMMVQGHTIDAFLADEYRTYDSFIYRFWVTLRGFTAPIFMVSSGVAFAYLFRSVDLPFNQNPRVTKGLMRFVILLLTAYLLRFPTYRMVDFSYVSNEQWHIFFTVDALHLIGIGILLILFFSYLSEKMKINEYWIYSLAAAFFFMVWNVTEYINWANYLPIPFAAYFYSGTGSLFPVFPWAGYVLAGALLGSFLAKNPGVYKTKKFNKELTSVGLTFLSAAAIISFIQSYFIGNKYFFTDNSFVILLRLGVVALLISSLSIFATSVKKIPLLVQEVGRYTLIVYAVHIIILYGSAWIPGFAMFWPKSLNLAWSILAAAAMIALMGYMVHLIHKYKPALMKNLAASKV